MVMKYGRRTFLQSVVGTAAWFANQPRNAPVQQSEITWYDVQEWGVEGKGWSNTERYFDRLPTKAKASVRKPVWELSRHSAGMCVHFKADTTELFAKYLLRSDRLDMPHMPATGVSGLDVYVRDERGQWRWLSVLQPRSQMINQSLVSRMPEGPKEFRVYLPLYNGIEHLAIGVPQGSTFETITPRLAKPMLFYGTSILHGACASRPGMAFPAILGRRFNLPTLNLGFSGNGRMEAEVAILLAELDPCVFIIDCLPNMHGEQVAERAPILIDILRQSRPNTPILLVEDRMNDNAAFRVGRVAHHLKNRQALQHVFLKAKEKGQSPIFYLNGEAHLGTDGDGTTDGSHPNDLGMVRYADNYEPILKRILSQH